MVNKLLANVALLLQRKIVYYSDEELTLDDVEDVISKKELSKLQDYGNGTAMGSPAYYAVIGTTLGNIPFPLLWKRNRSKVVKIGQHSYKE